jgi:hypothetical protein
MGKLYVFGCSFSALHNIHLLNDPSFKKYYEFRGDSFPISWSEILANKLGLELVNTAKWGSDNYTIFESFCKVSDKITSDDIVIIGWSQTLRFRLYSQITNNLTSLNVWKTNENHFFPNISEQTIDEIIVNRDSTLWVDEVYSWMKVITQLSKLVKFKLYYWSFFSEFPEMYVLNDVLDYGAEYITHETGGEVINEHMGEVGHQKQAQYFEDIILNKQKKLI